MLGDLVIIEWSTELKFCSGLQCVLFVVLCVEIGHLGQDDIVTYWNDINTLEVGRDEK